MNALAILSLKMEAVIGGEVPEVIRRQAVAFRNSLHQDSADMPDIYEDLASYYRINIKNDAQVETMLTCIAAIHSRDLEGCLAAIDRGIKYYGSTDLPSYFKLMTVYLGQMNEVRQSEPETWEQLKQDFVVTKSTQEFRNLLIDQGLEQEIKNLKRYGALPGLTQNEDLMERFITTSPHLVQLVEKFLSDFPKHTSPEDDPDAYHQLQGNLGL